MTRSPQVVVLAGPNGAGKSTLAPVLVQDTLHIDAFVNADVIAQGLSAFAPESTAMAAGRIMLERLHSLAASRVDFAFETTLSTRSYSVWIQRLREVGYRFRLFFLWLPSPEMAVLRVQRRVAAGGHDIEQATILRRYRAGLANFFRLYRPIADDWRFYNNSLGDSPRLIAAGKRRQAKQVADSEVWQSLVQEYDHD